MKTAWIFIFFIISSSAYSVDVQHFKRTNSFGFENLESARMTDSLYPNDYRFLFNLGLSLVDEPLTIKTPNNDEKTDVAIDQFLNVHVGLGFYLSERLWLGATTSYVFAGNNLDFGSTLSGRDWAFTQEDKSSGIEDISIEASYDLVKKERWGLALIPELYIPTGDKDKFIGDDAVGYGLTVAYEKRFEAWQLAMNLGYRYSPDAELSGLSIDYRNRVNTSIGAIFRLYKEKLFLNAEYRRFWMLPVESDQNPNEGYLGLRLRLSESFAAFGGASLGNFESSDGNTLRYSGGIKWFYKAKDQIAAKKDLVRKIAMPDPIVETVVDAVVEPVVVQSVAPREAPKVDCNLMKGLGSNNKAIIQFAHDGSQGHQKTVSHFDAVASIVLANKDKIKAVYVGGHTSKVGDASYNMQLSKKRAKVAANRLIAAGVSRSMISTRGFGETKLLNPGDSKDAHAANRRTEVQIVPTKAFRASCQ